MGQVGFGGSACNIGLNDPVIGPVPVCKRADTCGAAGTPLSPNFRLIRVCCSFVVVVRNTRRQAFVSKKVVVKVRE